MRLATGTTSNLRLGLVAIAALAFYIAFALANSSPVLAQSDGASENGTASAPAATDQSDQNGVNDADQQAHDAADAAQETLDSATEARDQLESDGASQAQIDAANQAIAQARANKEAADEAAQGTGDATSERDR